MEVVACDLEVDVNGEEIFFVNKEILTSFCGRLSKLFAKPSAMATTKNLKVILHDLPGGPEAFELITRFCYKNGTNQLTPSNTCLLHCAAQFMEMNEDSPSYPSLLKETEKSLKGIPYWTWSDVLNALKQCQDFFPMANSSGVLEKLLDCLIGRIAMTIETSPSGSSPDSTGFRFSFDTKSTMSTTNGHHRAWWFEDLATLNCQMIEKAIKSMTSRKVDHVTISRFLFYYLKVKCANATGDKKRESIETVIDLLFSLDQSSLSYKSLFGVLRVTSSQILSKSCRSRLESMIGCRIDEAILDNLLVPAPTGLGSLYDVDLVLRFLKHFRSCQGKIAMARLKRAGSLVDLYLAEVAPDSGLRPWKFIALAAALPDAARDSHDSMYRAIDMYIEVHARLSEEEKLKICCAINLEKLSSDSCKHLAQNAKLPSRMAIQALLSQQSKLKSLLRDTNNIGKVKHSEDGEQIVLYAKKLDLSVENEKLRANLEGMQWKVKELEKICKKMQTQMAKMSKTNLSNHSGSRSLPKLCS